MHDFIPFFIFLVVWWLYTFIADQSALKRHSISHAMDLQRQKWMIEAHKRDIRVADTGVMNILITGISFYGSATILVLGGLFAIFGYTQQLSEAFAHLPYAEPLAAGDISTRLLALIGVYIYAFFKFAWAFRQANYSSILLGTMGDHTQMTAEDKARAKAAAQLSALSARQFNRGIRSYFFSLALLGWFISVPVLVLSTCLVLFVLIRREFFSNSVAAIKALQR